MKPPSSSSKITKEWVQYIMQDYMQKKHHLSSTPDVTIKEFVVKEGASAGEGFNSEIVSLDVVAICSGDGAEGTSTDAEYHCIVKFFSTDTFSREANKRFESHLREHAIYSELIRDLNNFQALKTGNEFEIHIPELIYGMVSNKDFVLVMENVKVKGFNTNNRYSGLNFDQLKEAVNQLARLHAVSYAYNKSHNILKKFPFLKLNEEVVKVFESFCGVFIDNGIALLNTKDDMKDLAKKIKISKARLFSEFLKLYISSEDHISCICHGDFWNNNILFKTQMQCDHGNETKLLCEVIDWGNAAWGLPILDLQYLIYTSTAIEIRKEHLESVLHLYYSAFIDITTKLEVPVPNWSYDNFQKEWQRLSVFGFLMGIALTQGTLSKSNPVNKPREASLLDHSVCLPIKLVVDGVKLGTVKALTPLLFKVPASKLMIAMNRKLFQPIREEILSGKNEVLNKRIIDLMLEADEKGIFSE
ncbi:hypothetical protein SK128_018729 [Halocaridina rubra]|uniref:CHK kinase-like domain-containing protein n=1 Tax=Halocaridina rubra TaxID=373956 RepID=A0AAN8WW42_HALRR